MVPEIVKRRSAKPRERYPQIPQRFYVLCAFLALEKMLVKFIAQGRRKFAQHVLFRSLYSYSFVMVHFNP